MYQRKIEPLISEFLREFRIIYLTGPRQVGKTTLVRELANRFNMTYSTLDDDSILSAVNQDPYGFLNSYANQSLVIDEFQYAPQLISAIKKVSDALPPTTKGKFILTGSSDIFHSAKIQESLPGHMARLELYPLSINELTNNPINIIDYLVQGDFSYIQCNYTSREMLAEYILNGGYPEVQTKSQRSKGLWFQSYVRGRLFTDFEHLYAARGDYHSKMQALLPWLAGLSGNLLKYSHAGSVLSLDDKLIKNYIEILELMFIIIRLPGYLKNRAKTLATTMPKLHYIDTGLACHLLGLRSVPQLLASHHFGGLVENLVLMELKKQATWSLEPVEFYHFRDKDQHEVDIIMEKADGSVIGIEIKASSLVRSEDFKNLIKLAETLKSGFQAGFVFYTGELILPFTHNNIRLYAIPVALFYES